MSTIDERKKIAEEILVLTQSIQQIDKTLKDNFFVSKSLTSSNYMWGDVSMMYRDDIVDHNVKTSFNKLNDSVSELKNSLSNLLEMLREDY